MKETISRFVSYIDAIFNITAIIGLLMPLYKVEAMCVVCLRLLWLSDDLFAVCIGLPIY